MAKISSFKMAVFRRKALLLGIVIFLGSVGFLATTARAGDDTARFFGTWEAHIQANGQIITVISIHDANGYKNFVRQPTGDVPAGDGTFSSQ